MLRVRRAYTRRAGGQEHERGSISPGMRADLVVLDSDADGTPRVAETWVAGAWVHPTS